MNPASPFGKHVSESSVVLVVLVVLIAVVVAVIIVVVVVLCRHLGFIYAGTI